MGWTTPPTRAVGDPITVSDFNAAVRDNSNYLYGDTAWTTVASFSGAWSAGSPVPQYRKAGSLVLLRGVVTGGATNTGAFTLPIAYAPTSNLIIAVIGTNQASSVASVNYLGGVTPALWGGAVGIYLDSIVYSTL